MSKYFELMNRGELDSRPVQLPLRVAAKAGPALPDRYAGRVAEALEESFPVVLWRIIRNRRWTVALFTLVVTAIVLGASFLMKPQYEAVGRVVFHRSNDSSALGFKSVDTPPLEDADELSAIETQMSILKTDALAAQVIKDLQLGKNHSFTRRMKDPGNEEQLLSTFHKNLAISRVKGTQLIEIHFRNPNPKLAADVVNDLAKAYVDQNYKSQFQASTLFSDFLANQLTDLKSKVEQSQQKFLDYQKAHGISGVDDSQNIVTAKLNDVNRELTAAEADRVQKEINYRLARSGNPDMIATLEPDSLITKLRGQQADLQNQLAQESVLLGPANPKVVELSKQLAQVRDSVQAEASRIRDRLSYEYNSAVGREDMLRSALDAQKQAADELSANEIQSDILQHEFETNRKLYEDLLQKQKEVGISAGLKSSNIWIVDPARPPRLPIEPNIPRNFGLSLVFGVFGGVALAFGLEKMHERICTLEQAVIVSPAPSLGVVPLLGVKPRYRIPPQFETVGGSGRPELVSSLRPMSLAAESYKAMVTSILLSHRTHPSVILVTSALPGEGKTTVSSNLAIVLARLRRRVLLVDTDLRRPSVHRAFGLPSNAGLGALLRKSATFDETVVGCANVPNLHILTAGPVYLPEDTELLVCCFKELVDSWRQQFDHVIIDTPPVLAMTDAVRMSVEADSVILVARAGLVTKNDFVRAQELLIRVNARLTGFVLNGAQLDSSDFRYFYGYYGQQRPKRLSAGA
jgi:polysaccharide biosynthesis transport protein